MTDVEVLKGALDLLKREGWNRGSVRGLDGTRCALGAVRNAAGMNELTPEFPPSLKDLEAAIPDSFERKESGFSYCYYNNSRKSFSEIEAWFGRAIELAESRQMYQELAKPAPAPEPEPAPVDLVSKAQSVA